jgi:transposase
MRNWVFVKVETSEPGLIGWGEASLEWKTRAVVGAVEDFAPMLVGEDSARIEHLYQKMYRQSFFRPGVIGMSAVYETFDIGLLIDLAQEVVARGYSAVKVVFVPYSEPLEGLPRVRQFARLFGALREAVGDQIDIMADFHGRTYPAMAIEYIRAIAEFSPFFCEEPVPPENADALSKSALKVRIMWMEIVPSMYHVTLTREERHELKRRTRPAGIAPSTRDRLEMARLSDVGWSVPKIARHLGQHEQTVRSGIKAFLAGGLDALENKPRGGKQCALTPVILAAIGQEIARGERTWTAGQIADWVAQHHGVRLSADRVRIHLKRAKLSYKRTSRSLKHRQKPEEVARKNADLQTLGKRSAVGAMPVCSTCATWTKPGSL